MAVYVTGGSLAELGHSGPDVPRGIWIGGPLSLSWSYQEIWRTQPQVRTVVSFLARNIAQLGLHVYERVSEVDRRRATEHPLAKLIRRPNEYTTRYRLINALVSDLAIFDNAIWAKAGNADGDWSLVRVPPQMVTPIGTDPLRPEAYKVDSGGLQRVILTPDQVVHFRGHNAIDVRWGASPLEALRQILAEEAAATEYREGMWESGARVSGVIERPADAPQWSDPARSRFRTQWQQMYAGDGARVGGTAILEDGMTFTAMGQTAKDAQYVEARKLTREEVATAYHIPPPMVGILDNATFSNITEQHRMLYQDTLGPWLTMIEEEIELQLLPNLGDPDQEYVEFNMAEKLKGSFEEQAESLSTATGRPWMTADEARARANLPSLGGDAERLITPLNVVVDGATTDEATVAEEDR